MSFKDKHIPCKDYGGEFVFTAGEQEFYAQKGFTNEPTRCPAGRRARKEGRNLTDITGGRVCPTMYRGMAASPTKPSRRAARPVHGVPMTGRARMIDHAVSRVDGQANVPDATGSRIPVRSHPIRSMPQLCVSTRQGGSSLRTSIIHSSMCMSTDRSSARFGGRSRRVIRSRSLSRRVIAVRVRERSICDDRGETCVVE